MLYMQKVLVDMLCSLAACGPCWYHERIISQHQFAFPQVQLGSLASFLQLIVNQYLQSAWQHSQ